MENINWVIEIPTLIISFLCIGHLLRDVVFGYLFDRLFSLFKCKNLDFGEFYSTQGVDPIETYNILLALLVKAPELTKENYLDQATKLGLSENVDINTVSKEIISEIRDRRIKATKALYSGENKYYRKIFPQGLEMFPNSLDWRSFWCLLSRQEQKTVCGLIFLMLWHSVGIIAGLRGQIVWGSLITLAGNIGDLLEMLLFGKYNNFNGARNIQQLILHHVISALGIPFLILFNVLDMDMIFTYQIALELSGTLGILWSLTCYTPLKSRAYFPFFTFILLLEICYHRIWIWILLGIEHLFNFRVFVLCLHIAMGYFNWFFVSAFMKRQTLPKDISPYALILTSILSTRLSLTFILFLSPILYLLSSHVSTLLVFCIGASVILMLILHGLGFFNFWRRKVVRKEIHEFSSYEECKVILNSREFSPLPHRYFAPRPAILPFASWVKAMLLYNDEGHARLRLLYPPLNRPSWVREHFHRICAIELQKLIRKCDGEFDLMATIATKLPSSIIRHIAGFPEKDIPRVATLISTMGDFVG